MRTLALLLAAGVALCSWLTELQPAADSQQAGSEGREVIQKNAAVKMRDGVTLRADVLLPAAEGKFPVLVYRTPYGKDRAPSSWTTFPKAVARGYAVVIQDVRGRYESEGEFDPYKNEGRDGYDTIEWAAAQPWSNGDVGTFGLSYPGAVQWLAAVENPPHLKAMVPAMTFSTPRNFFYSGGVFDGSWLDWIWSNIAPDIRKRKNLPGPKTRSEVTATWKQEHERMQKFLPMSDLPDLKNVAPFYYEWLAHPPADSWWDWAELRAKYARTQAAVLNISGWYDEAYGPDGATTNFNGLLAARKGQSNPRTAAIIGPWTHGELERGYAGDRDFGKSAAVDYDEIILRWMDHYLKGIDNGVGREKPVRIFVMGDNVWRDEDAWPLARAKDTALYLASVKQPDSAALSLSVAPCKKCAKYSEFTSDPMHPVTDPYTALGARDYRSFVGRRDVLVFDSEPMAADTEVTGPVRAEIYASAEVPDFDLWVRLLDFAPDGKAYNLMSPGLDVLRASYRNGSAQPQLLKPGEIVRLNLDRLLTSNVFKSGHRIRVQISAAFFPHFSRNLQTGKSEAASSESRIGRIRIYDDAEHASRIVLPVSPRGDTTGVIHRLGGSTITTGEAEEFAKATLEKDNVTGAQIAVVENGCLTWGAAFGQRGQNPELPMNRETTTWAASITKGLFTTYVMQLVERGEFQLDVPVAKQLSQPLDHYDVYRETGSAIVSEPDWALVTPRVLLSHTSGFLNFAYLEPDKKLHLHFKPGTNTAIPAKASTSFNFSSSSRNRNRWISCCKTRSLLRFR